MGKNSNAFILVGANGEPYSSPHKGSVGGHRRSKIFGRLDCPAARRAIANGGYVAHRVFFADAGTAVRAGFRPCAVCMSEAYRAWKLAGQPTATRRRRPAAHDRGAQIMAPAVSPKW